MDHGVEVLAGACSTIVLEPLDVTSNWFKDLFDRNSSEPLLDEGQIEIEIVDVNQWGFLDDTTKARFRDVGLTADMPRRTEAEAEALYEEVPGTTRALGEERLLEFLDTHTLTYVTPIDDVVHLADAPDNLVWELQSLNEARGERPMTAEELAAAVIALGRKEQEAVSLSGQTWYVLNRDPGFMAWFKQLGLDDRTRTQAEALELYKTIPEAFRNEGIWAVWHFLQVHALTYRLPVGDNPQLASSFSNVVWEDHRVHASRRGRPMTDSDIAAAEQALWAKSVTAGHPSSRTWYRLLQDREALGWLRLAGEQTLAGFTGTLVEVREVYESMPELVRVAGPDAVRMYLTTHSPVHTPGLIRKDSAAWYLPRAIAVDNLVWEAHELAEGRGPRAMTFIEIDAAEQVLRTRFEAAESSMALGFVPEIQLPQPVLGDISVDVRGRLARLGLTSDQPDRMPSEILAIYASIPAPVRVRDKAQVEDFLDRFTISHPLPAAFEPGHRIAPAAFVWDKHGTVRARGNHPMSPEEILAAKSLMLRVAAGSMPMATWSVLKNNPEFRLHFDQLEDDLSVPEEINVLDLYLTIPRSVLLLGPDTVLRFLSEFGLSLKRPVSEFLALANVPTQLAWETKEFTVARDDRNLMAHESEPGKGPAGMPFFSVEGDSWDTLDVSLQQRLAFVGLTSNSRYRTFDETVSLYQSIPAAVRDQGNEAVWDFLEIHTVSRKISLAELQEVATNSRNSVWESFATALARGDRPATEEEIAAARQALVETYIQDLEVLKADGIATGLVAGIYVGSRQVLPRLQTPPPPVTSSGTWGTLDPLLRQRFAGRGIPVGLPRRTALEAQALYETVPSAIRVQGNAAVRDFLDTHALSYRNPITEFPDLARVPGNTVWEPLDMAIADGSRSLTDWEAYQARRAMARAARLATTRSGMTWVALNEDQAFVNNLKRRGLSGLNQTWTQAEAKRLYSKIPLGVRNQGPDAVKTFLAEYDLSHIESVSRNPARAKDLNNVVWEDPSLNRARRANNMSRSDLLKARGNLAREGLQAGSRSNRTWYTIAQDPERLAKIRQLGLPEGQLHTRFDAKSMYEKIPRGVRELGVDQVDEFIKEFDLSHRLGRSVRVDDDLDITWEKRRNKLKRGTDSMSDRQFNNGRRALADEVSTASKSLKDVKNIARKAALKTAARGALMGGLGGTVLELPVSGVESFFEWHHGRMTAEEAIVQAAVNTGVSAAAGAGIVLAMSAAGPATTTLAASYAASFPITAGIVATATPVIVPVVVVVGVGSTLVFVVHRICTAAQPGTAEA